MKRILSIILSLSILITFTACGSSGGDANLSGGKPPGKEEQVILSPENLIAKTEAGVTVELSEYILDDQVELTVVPLATEEDSDEGYKIESYEISLEGMTQLDDFITIRIPYDSNYCLDGQDPSKCVGAKYYNEENSQWEDIMFTVDSSAMELVITTDHLSRFGAFHIKDETRRFAYIDDLNSDLSLISEEAAAEVLREFIENGSEGGKAASVGAHIVSTMYDLSSDAGTEIDWSTNPINLIGLGQPNFDSKLLEQGYETIGKIGKVVSVVKIASTIVQTEGSDEDILGLYKDVSYFMMGLSTNATLGFLASTIWLYDVLVGKMFEMGMEMKQENIGKVYFHYNDYFREGAYKARTLKDWRQVMIDLTEANAGDEKAVQEALDAEIDRYSKAFWNLPVDEQSIVASDLDENYSRMAYPTQADIEKLTQDYKKNLYDRLYPVATSVRNYFMKKAEAEYLKELNKAKSFYNQTIRLSIEEDLADGEQSQYAGYTMRLTPLKETAEKRTWTGTISDEGKVAARMTLLGYILAGSPNQVALFKPGDDPDLDQPELEIPFILSAPETLVKIGKGLPLEAVLGNYAMTTTTSLGDSSFSEDMDIQILHSGGKISIINSYGTFFYWTDNTSEADNAEYVYKFDYDPSISRLTVDILETYDNGNSNNIVELWTFSEENGKIVFSGTVEMRKDGQSAMMPQARTGVKVD